MTEHKIHSSARALLTGLIDYAGLFPPAGLDMPAAVKNFLSYQDGPYGWMLGRFIVPIERLAELQTSLKGRKASITVLFGNSLDQDLATAAQHGVDTIELKASTVSQIRGAAEKLAPGLTAYFEIPIGGNPLPLVEAIGEAGVRAKVRTGGLTPESFPGSRDLVRFLKACTDQQVAFKATAGLHHPVRRARPLTSDPESPIAEMHGFLNVFLAAALLRAGEETQKVVQLLEDQANKSFSLSEEEAKWRDELVDVEQIEDTRKNLAISFGSCSFDEPVADLKDLGIL